MSDPATTIHLELPLAQVQVIFMCLNKGQFDYVEPTVVNIRSQVQEQLNRQQPSGSGGSVKSVNPASL